MNVEGQQVRALKRGETYKYYGSNNVKKVKYLHAVVNAWSGRRWYLFKVLTPGFRDLLLSRGEVLSLIREV